MNHQPETLLPSLAMQRKQLNDYIENSSHLKQVIGVCLMQIRELGKLLNVETLKRDPSLDVNKIDFIYIGKLAASLTQDINTIINPISNTLINKINAFETKGKEIVTHIETKPHQLNSQQVHHYGETLMIESSLLYGETQDWITDYNITIIPTMNEILKTIGAAIVPGAKPITLIQPYHLSNVEGTI